MSSVNSSNPSTLGTLGGGGTSLVSEISACAEISLVICSVKRSTASTLSLLPRCYLDFATMA